MRNDQLHPNSEKSESDYHAIYMHTVFCGIGQGKSLSSKVLRTILVHACAKMVQELRIIDH
jgi:hypothetical protein